MESFINGFEKLWTDFLDTFKGSLINQSKTQRLSYPIVKLSFSESVLTWTSDYSLQGRWLSNLVHNYPQKGQLVKDVLTKDMSLKEVSKKNADAKLNTINIIGPIGIGILGYATAKIIGLGLTGTVCSTIIPTVIAIPVVKTLSNTSKEKDVSGTINEYVGQLAKYKDAVLTILSAAE